MTVIGSAEIVVRPNLSGFERELRSQTQKVATKTPAAKVAIGVDTGKSDNVLKRFNGSLDTLDKRLQTVGLSTRDASVLLGAGLAGGIAFAARAVVGFAVNLVGVASALNEQRSATEALFGANSDLVQSFAESASSIGLSERAALKAANAYGDLFINLGLSSELAGKASIGLVALAADLASFKDITGGAEEAGQRLIQGLVGQQEALRPLGVLFSADEVAAKALVLRTGELTGEISEGEKVIARLALTLDRTTNSQGDYKRTADSVANTQRRLNAEFENSKAALGEGLQKPTTFLLQQTSNLLATLNLLGGAVADVTTLNFGGLRDRIDDSLKSPSERAAAAVRDLKKSLKELAAEARDANFGFTAVKEAIEGLAPTFTKSLSAAESAAGRLTSAQERLAKASESGAERVADANRSLARTTRDAAERVAAAEQNILDVQRDIARGLVDIQERVADAARSVADAERALVETRVSGAESIADAERRLQELLNPRRLSQRQQRAQEIEEARKALEKARAGAVDDLKDARERVEDARRAQDEAERARLEFVEDSTRRQQEAERSLATTIRDTGEQIIDARRRVAEANRDSAREIAAASADVAQASKDVATNVDDVTEALDKANIRLSTTERKLLELAHTADTPIARFNALKTLIDSLALRPIELDTTEAQKKLEAMNRELVKILLNSSTLASIGIGGGQEGQVQGVPIARQHGGPIRPGQSYLVGERGPELRTFDQPGQIISNDSLAQLTRAIQSSGRTNQNTFNMNLPSIADPDFFARAIAMRLGQMMYR